MIPGRSNTLVFQSQAAVQADVTLGHETVGVVAAIGDRVTSFEVGDRVCADASELCGKCHFCRLGEELLCEHFEAHGVTLNGGFAEYCAYPGETGPRNVNIPPP